jgi:signal transduction histidine kinase
MNSAKLKSYYFPAGLIITLIVTLVLVRWWQLIFKESFQREQDSAVLVLEKEMFIAADNIIKKNELIEQGKIKIVSQCDIVPCIFSQGSFLQIEETYLKSIEKQKKKRINMIRWETGFLITLLFSASGFILFLYQKERKQHREQEDFVTMTTHELKHPVTSVSLILQSLNRDTIPIEKKSILIEKGLSEINALNEQIENLIKIKQIKELQKKEEVSYILNDFITNMLEKLEARGFNTSRINLVYENKSLKTRINKTGLELLLTNLVENSLKYSKEVVTLSLEKSNTSLVVSIEDKGVGFTSEEKKQLGKLFYRSKRHAVQNIKGTGIGLYTVFKLAKVLDVRVELTDTTPKQGATFKLRFTSV